MRYRDTKIVATLGPATDAPGVLDAMVEAGVDVVRLNFSYGSHEEHAQRLEMVRAAAAAAGRQVAVLQDLQGPKVRVGRLRGGTVELRDGASIAITGAAVEGTSRRFATTYSGLAGDVARGQRLLLDDGRLELRVADVADDEIRCDVVRGGTLREHKGLNIPGADLRLPAVTEKDADDLRFGLAHGVDLVALSFVRAGEDARPARKIMAEAGRRVPLLAKIEKPEALDRLTGVVRSFDGVMVARGDLGVELSVEKVPAAQKRIIARANAAGKPAITATQMLESMTESEYPTRAEASDVANAVLDGTDAVMLSGETAVGKHPALVVQAMDQIVREAERIDVAPEVVPASGDATVAVCQAAAALASGIDAAAIVAYTRTGRTARTLSKLRPRAPILALCERPEMARALALWRGVVPVVVEAVRDPSALADRVSRDLRGRELVAAGERVVVVGSAPEERPRATNFIRVLAV